MSELAGLLDSPEIARLTADLEATRWTGRPGYPIRSMIGMALAKSIYAISTWTRTVALVREHPGLIAALGSGECPSVYACYRFAAKLREHKHLLDACIGAVLVRLHDANPELGENVAIDASDLPAYANGQRFASKGGRERADSEFSDPTLPGGTGRPSRRAAAAAAASACIWQLIRRLTCRLPGPSRQARRASPRWSRRCSTRWHCSASGPRPARWTRATTTSASMTSAPSAECRRCSQCARRPMSSAAESESPHCFHGPRRFAGADYGRRATKWRCPVGQCTPNSVWVKADRLHPLIPRETLRWKGLYRKRGGVEREFGRLKGAWALAPLRVRRIERVRVHADLTILAKLMVGYIRACRSSDITESEPTTQAAA